ncbi:MAG TPA: alpha-aminoadipate/glutamate carrier protein LysW/ArgW [Nitrosopumilaceae archaeon]|nr:alpha-aminoadipate/glutamate carrier protein LysW/ArgW [Nitrosopumilaceae archaeon]
MNCPECDATLNILDDASVGEIVSCPDCGADFEIASKDGSNVVLKQAESVGEDWGE